MLKVYNLKILFIGGTNLGSAVATSMNLTNSSEPMGEPSTAPHYKLEPSHDVVYYQVRVIMSYTCRKK